MEISIYQSSVKVHQGFFSNMTRVEILSMDVHRPGPENNEVFNNIISSSIIFFNYDISDDSNVTSPRGSKIAGRHSLN